MSQPDERPTGPDTAESGSEHDPEVAEAYAESVGIDPTPEQIDHYLEIEGEPSLAEQARSSDEDPGPA